MPIKFKPLAYTAYLICALSPSAQADLNIYVSPDGNDHAAIDLESIEINNKATPFASIVGARNAVRAWRSFHTEQLEPINIIFLNGLYPISKTVIFESTDGGTADAPIRYKAALNAKPVFTSRVQINDWKLVNNEWIAPAPLIDGSPINIQSLFMNNKRLVRAREPDNGYFYMAGKAPAEQIKAFGDDRKIFMAKLRDIQPLRTLTANEIANIDLIIYHSWQASHHRIANIDFDSGMITLSSPAPWPLMKKEPNQRYIIENFPQALNTAGEWFLDINGQIHYRPHPDETLSTSSFFTPSVEQLVIFNGSISKPVEHILFDGITFEYSDYAIPHEGHQDRQASPTLPAAITTIYARNINFDNLILRHLGAYGIWIRNGSSKITIQNSLIEDMAGGGIKIGETKTPASELDQTGHNIVSNNIIRSGGRRFPGAVGIWVGHSGHNTIIHNDIYDLYYSGISVGWIWGYNNSLAIDNQIEFNRIYMIGQGVLSDMGGIYTLGPSPGTTIKNNVIHDIQVYDYGGWGIYNDEGSSEIIVANNLVYLTQSGGYHLHYGKNLIVENNIFAKSKEFQVQITKLENFPELIFRKNIIYDTGQGLFKGPWRKNNVTLDSNIYFESKNNAPIPPQIQDDRTSTITDPMFVNPENNDFTIKKDSPAFLKGFKAIDPSKAGADISKMNNFKP